MRLTTILLATLGILMSMECRAQISVKTEYIGSSDYMYLPKDEDAAIQVGDSKGSAMVYSLNANIPVYQKMNENNRITMWGIGIGGSYTSMTNKYFTDDMVSDITNFQLGLLHIRPISDSWSIIASVGAGVFSPTNKFKAIKTKHILGSAGVIFVKHFNNNIDFGGGIAVNNSFGYPMVFPALYFNWNREGKIKANVSLGDAVSVSLGYNFTNCFNLSAVWEMAGQMALVEKEGKDKIFTHQYMITGLRPEIKLGKSGFSIPITLGINIMRPSYYSDKSWKGMFSTDNDYYFTVSPYVSVAIQYGF